MTKLIQNLKSWLIFIIPITLFLQLFYGTLFGVFSPLPNFTDMNFVRALNQIGGYFGVVAFVVVIANKNILKY